MGDTLSEFGVGRASKDTADTADYRARNENRRNLLCKNLPRKNSLAESPTGHRLVAAVVEFAVGFVAGFVIDQDIVASAAGNHQMAVALRLYLRPWADMISF